MLLSLPKKQHFGVPVRERVHKGTSVKSRFLKLVFLTGHGSSSITLDNYQIVTTSLLYGLCFKETYEGENLLIKEGVSVTSNYHTSTSMNNFLTGVKNRTYATTLTLPPFNMFEITIDLKKQFLIAFYGVGIYCPQYSWLLYGSNDNKNWKILHHNQSADLLEKPSTSFKRFGAHWYFFDIIWRKDADSFLKSKPYAYWGVVFDEPKKVDAIEERGADDLPSVDVSEVEFRDGVAGTNLCTGGEVVFLNLDDKIPDAFDTVTTFTVSNNIMHMGAAYHFSQPVSPVELAVYARGYTPAIFNELPKGLMVVCSDDGDWWMPYKYFDTNSSWSTTGSFVEDTFLL